MAGQIAVVSLEPDATPGTGAGTTPYTGDIEIRVHGVSGTPPQELLGRADVRQVAGDRLSGFYRPGLAEQMRDEPPPDAPGPRPAGTGRPARGPWLEGYSWGGWTSGARSRVLWLVLLPFALVNVATRMLPPEPAGGAAARRLRLAAAGLVRVLALSLTVTMVQGAVGVSMVTIALRCGTTPGRPGSCHGLPVIVTDLLGRLPTEGRVLLCAAVPLAVTVLLWLVSHRVSARYEDAPQRPSDGRPDDAPHPLLRRDLWHSGPVISRLRLVHVQAALASVVGTAAWLLPGGTARTVTLWLTAATFAAGVTLVAVRPRAPYTADRRGRIMLPARLVWILLAACTAGLTWQVWRPSAGGGPAGGAGAAGGPAADLAVRHADVLVQDLFIGQAVLLAVIGVLVAAARVAGAGRGRPMFVSGFAGFLVAMLAWLTGAMLTASVLILVPAWLARPGFAFTPRQIATALADPATAGWFGNTTRSSGVGTGIGVAVLVILLLQLAVRAVIASRTGGARRDRDAVARDYPSPAGPAGTADVTRRRQIATMFWWARRVDGVPGAMAMLCAAIAAMLAVQGAALIASSTAPGGWAAAMLGRTTPACRAAAETGLCSHVDLVAWGVFGTAGIAVLVLVAGVLAYRTAAVRRGVGVFWDLACFWPRDAHPLAPPCYNERIMPQVSKRVAWYLGGDDRPGAADIDASGAADIESAGAGDKDKRGAGEIEPAGAGGVEPAGADGVTPGPAGAGGVEADGAGGVGPGPATRQQQRGRVVIAGHSQGSVIALAAALIQPESARRRLSLVTVGCVLDRLYSRFFPRYFGPEVYRMAGRLLGADGPSGLRWINIWRHSDYLGGSVPYPPSAGPQPPAAMVHGPRNVRSTDPVFAAPAGDTVPPAARRHSDFWADPVFLPAVREVLDLSRTDAAEAPATDLAVTPDATR